MISTQEMAALEELSEKYGVSKLKLMENAGRGMFKKMNEKYCLAGKSILIICGSGNNGGDGLALAKYLHNNNVSVNILFLGKVDKLKKESGYNYLFLMDHAKKLFCDSSNYEQLIKDSDIIVDAMIGTGVKGQIKEPYSEIIDLINGHAKEIICVDVPTGLNPDTGEILDKIVKFDIIYTFHDIKTGLAKFKDNVVIVDIGIPKEAVNKLKGQYDIS